MISQEMQIAMKGAQVLDGALARIKDDKVRGCGSNKHVNELGRAV